MNQSTTSTPHRIVIVGGGAGGFELATRLGDTLGRRGKAEITLIERKHSHVWKPKLHEIAAGSMDFGDHEVGYLAHAHRHGASSWTRAQRRIFANDFENLLVVDDATNQAKSDKAPHEWLPPDKTFWCEYGRRWQRVKDKYRLLFSAAERYVLKQLADTCLQ